MKKTMVTKVSDRGQVSVPADVRAALGITPGVSIQWELVDDNSARVTAMVAHKNQGAQSLIGFAKRFRKLRRSDEWFK